jgi:hypothetical protein
MRKVSAAAAGTGAVSTTSHSVTRVLNRDIVLTSPLMREIADSVHSPKVRAKLRRNLARHLRQEMAMWVKDSRIDDNRLLSILGVTAIRGRELNAVR